MNLGTKILATLGIAAVVVLVAVWLGVFRPAAPPAGGSTDPVSEPEVQSPAATQITSPRVNAKRPETPLPLPDSQTPTAAPATETNLITNWEEKLDELLRSSGEDGEKAKQMLAMLPHLPATGQVDVVQHIVNLTPDEDFPALARLAADAKQPEDVLDVLLADALNRPDSLKLPMLLDLARNPEHPHAGEAKDLLELYLEEDYGTDWNTWQQKIEEWVKNNPD